MTSLRKPAWRTGRSIIFRRGNLTQVVIARSLRDTLLATWQSDSSRHCEEPERYVIGDVAIWLKSSLRGAWEIRYWRRGNLTKVVIARSLRDTLLATWQSDLRSSRLLRHSAPLHSSQWRSGSALNDVVPDCFAPLAMTAMVARNDGSSYSQ